MSNYITLTSVIYPGVAFFYSDVKGDNGDWVKSRYGFAVKLQALTE